MANPIIKLSSIDRLICQLVGGARNAAAADQGRKLENGRRDLGIETHAIGALGEYAFARWLNINWQPLVGELDTERGDVGEFQIKSSLNRDGHLYVRTQDPDHFVYVRCFVNLTQVELMGWAYGYDVKKQEFWKVEGVHKPCYAYPQSRLLTMDDLKHR